MGQASLIFTRGLPDRFHGCRARGGTELCRINFHVHTRFISFHNRLSTGTTISLSNGDIHARGDVVQEESVSSVSVCVNCPLLKAVGWDRSWKLQRTIKEGHGRCKRYLREEGQIFDIRSTKDAESDPPNWRHAKRARIGRHLKHLWPSVEKEGKEIEDGDRNRFLLYCCPRSTALVGCFRIGRWWDVEGRRRITMQAGKDSLEGCPSPPPPVPNSAHRAYALNDS